MLELDCSATFDPAAGAEFFAEIPPRPGVLQIDLRGPGALPHLIRTSDLRRSAERLLRPPEGPTKRLNLRDVATKLRYRVTASRFEQGFVLYQHARALYPGKYRERLRLRPAALLKVNLANEYPRCYVTRRILSDGGLYLGPFPSRRAGQAFADEFLNLFKIRRCLIKIRRDPLFPGCIYSEMKMCLAPCFAGCTKEQYDVEVFRVVAALDSAGGSQRAELEQEREAASDTLDYERAAALHKRLEKIDAVFRNLPGLARRIDDLRAVVAVPAAEEQTVEFFAVVAGSICEPFLLRFGELSSQPRSAEQMIREYLERAGAGSPDLNSRADHLALLARWFYGKPRTGEIFFPTPEWPYRRILRACGRLLSGEKGSPDDAPGASQ